MTDIKENILKYFNDINFDYKGKTFLVGFSGGHGSLALLDIMSKFKNVKLIALHINHNWRGEESDLEEQNCRLFCEKNSIDFVSEKLKKGLPKKEEIARKKRYEIFNKYAKKYSVNAILTAHTKSDSIETTVYNLIKGTGLNGISGIPKVRNLENQLVLRPLIYISREEIDNYLNEFNLVPNEDSSNNNLDYSRNYIRHEVLPGFEKINKNAKNAIYNFSQIVQNNNEILTEYLENIKKSVCCKNEFYTQKFLELSKNIQNNLIYDYIITCDEEPTFEKINYLIQNIKEFSNFKTGKKCSFSKQNSLFISSEKFYFIKTIKKNKILNVKLDIGSLKAKIDDKEFVITENTDKIKKFPEETEKFIYANINDNLFPLTLRTRCDGDVIQPFGMKGSMKLKKYFINKNIPEHKRSDIILLCKNNEVLWAVGVGMSEKLRVKNIPQYKIEIL